MLQIHPQIMGFTFYKPTTLGDSTLDEPRLRLMKRSVEAKHLIEDAASVCWDTDHGYGVSQNMGF